MVTTENFSGAEYLFCKNLLTCAFFFCCCGLWTQGRTWVGVGVGGGKVEIVVYMNLLQRFHFLGDFHFRRHLLLLFQFSNFIKALLFSSFNPSLISRFFNLPSLYSLSSFRLSSKSNFTFFYSLTFFFFPALPIPFLLYFFTTAVQSLYPPSHFHSARRRGCSGPRSADFPS